VAAGPLARPLARTSARLRAALRGTRRGALHPELRPSPRTLRLAFAALVLAVTGAVTGSVVERHVGDYTRPLAYRDLTHAIGRLTVFGRPTSHVFRHERNYVRYISERLGTAVPAGYPTHMVVLFAVGPRSSPSYRLTVAGVVETKAEIVVRLREIAPGPADRAPSRLTSPYRAISIRWSAKPVTIDWLGRP